MDIRYKDILMKNDKRDEYDTYYSRLGKQYSNKKTSVKTNKYYNIDVEFNNFNSLVRDKIKLLRGFRDSLLYVETIEEQDTIKVEIQMRYFNSSSAKFFFDFFEILEDAAKNGKSVDIEWKYRKNDSSMMEAGEDFEEDMEESNFNLVESD